MRFKSFRPNLDLIVSKIKGGTISHPSPEPTEASFEEKDASEYQPSLRLPEPAMGRHRKKIREDGCGKGKKN